MLLGWEGLKTHGVALAHLCILHGVCVCGGGGDGPHHWNKSSTSDPVMHVEPMLCCAIEIYMT